MSEPAVHASVSTPAVAAQVPPARMGWLGTVVLVASGCWVVTTWVAALAAFPAQAESLPGAQGFRWLATLLLIVAVQVCTVVVAYVVTCIWLMQGFRTARALDPDRLGGGPGWVWLGWLVPLAATTVARSVIDDVWRVLADRTGGTAPSTSGWRVAWFLALAANVLPFVYWPFASSDAMPQWRVVAAVLLTYALVRWAGVVRGLSRDHDREDPPASLST